MEACLEELSLRSRWGLMGRRGRARVTRKCEVLGVSLQGLQKSRGVGYTTRQIAASILCERNEDYYVSSEKVTQRYRQGSDLAYTTGECPSVLMAYCIYRPLFQEKSDVHLR